jgi:choline-sulfatase
LIDAYPTIVEAVGEPSTAADQALPGTSLLRLLDGKNTDRTVFSEYHAVGSLTGIFMVRFGRYKYVHYEGYRPQLFDVAADPMETRDLALASGYDAALGEGDRRLRAICDPAKVSQQAFEDQERRIRELGGTEAVLKRGSYPYTPAPGEAPRYS